MDFSAENAQYVEILQTAGFDAVRTVRHSETRKRYLSFAELESEVMARKGKSILFELSDAQLSVYCMRLNKLSKARVLEEIDPWTIWIGAVQ